MCEEVYNLDGENPHKLNLYKIPGNIQQIFKTMGNTGDQGYVRLVFIIFRMLCQQRLIDLVKFNTFTLYQATFYDINGNIIDNQELWFKYNLSKIWIRLLCRHNKAVQISTLDMLIHFAILFSKTISCKLKNASVGSGNFELTMNKKKMLYIIYLVLVAFPIINNERKLFVWQVLIDLHISFQQYFQKNTFEDLSFENQFLLIQYYIKSFVTLHIEISPHDDVILNRFFERIITYPSLKLHYNFLACQFFFKFSIVTTNRETYRANDLIKIKKFINDLIIALSNGQYISKLKRDGQLFLYENLKNVNLSMIENKFISLLFNKCFSQTVGSIQCPEAIDTPHDEHETCRKRFKSILISFNKSNYLSKKNANLHLSSIEMHDENVCQIPPETDKSGFLNVLYTVKKKPLTFQQLFRLFIMVFEMRFIYDDIKSYILGLDLTHRY
ncbi:hypothetical protein RF11_09407 [Thelohanellus kitauei]|uniref:Uncharacterized protein n=1 Tax=Thelohanellus kitauei TaxID=669202 RepID=A0A0C2MWE8_THEKT|nr:hypothetical protein RF11_09407 [Thelohanellus kitauei]